MLTYQRATWFIILIWLLINAATLNYNGPFFDEAIYITAGQRTLEGHGYTDRYLVWFAGSLLWPMLAAVGYEVGGLFGTRLLAVLLSAAALAAVVRVAHNLFGTRAAFWTALAFAFSGPFIALSRLGVVDIPALAGIALSLWAVTELVKHDDRRWLLVSSVCFTAAFFGKYPMGLMALPLAGLLILLRRQKALMDISIFGFVGAALTLAFYLPGREQLSQVIPWTLGQVPTFGYTVAMLWFELVYISVVPVALALIGCFIVKEKQALCGVLVSSLFIWPAYHILSGNPVGQQKHVVFGFLFAYPLIGWTLSRLWDTWAGRVVVGFFVIGMAVLGLPQASQFGRWWPDVRGAAAYLVMEVEPGQKLLINESWPYIMYLYANERINSPWDVFDHYRITHGDSTIDLCEYDWFVDSKGSYDWPEPILREIEQCGHFEPVYRARLIVFGLDRDLDLLNYPVSVTIWKNTSRTALHEKLED